MSEALKFVPPRVPLIDSRTGLISREWFLFFQGVFERIGGATGPSTTDISSSLFEDAGSGETNSLLFALDRSLNQVPVPPAIIAVDQLLAEISEMRDTISELRKEIDALKQGTLM